MALLDLQELEVPTREGPQILSYYSWWPCTGMP
jgi:hypothetical protein